MEGKQKNFCSSHIESNAISFCEQCKIYMCNKCLNFHTYLFKNHHTYNLDKNKDEIFTGICQENNHDNKLEYFCNTHNKLCCCACTTKIKKMEKVNIIIVI